MSVLIELLIDTCRQVADLVALQVLWHAAAASRGWWSLTWLL